MPNSKTGAKVEGEKKAEATPAEEEKKVDDDDDQWQSIFNIFNKDN